MRVSGSRYLAALGMQLALIQILARWGGDMILHYVADAPLAKIAERYVKLNIESDLGTMRENAITNFPAKANDKKNTAEDEIQFIADDSEAVQELRE